MRRPLCRQFGGDAPIRNVGRRASNDAGPSAEEMGMAPQRRKVEVEEIFSFKDAGCCGTAAVRPNMPSTATAAEGGSAGDISRRIRNGAPSSMGTGTGARDSYNFV